MVDIVRAPWDELDWLRHGFSTRAGGVSTVYGDGPAAKSLNLGWTKEDSADAVRQNRRLFLRQVRQTSAPGDLPDRERPFDIGSAVVGLQQRHSNCIQMVEAADGALEGRLESPEGRPVLAGDGIMTDVPGVMVGVGVADCVPVLVADRTRRAVAAFHAGWRGTAARIVEHGIAMMRTRYGSQPEDLIAAIGPSIGPCCYEVGEDLRSAFASEFSYAERLFTTSEESSATKRLTFDLWHANRQQLLDAGVPAAHIHVVGECTACTRTAGRLKYFSHRAEAGVTGRMLAVIGVAEDAQPPQ